MESSHSKLCVLKNMELFHGDGNYLKLNLSFTTRAVEPSMKNVDTSKMELVEMWTAWFISKITKFLVLMMTPRETFLHCSSAVREIHHHHWIPFSIDQLWWTSFWINIRVASDVRRHVWGHHGAARRLRCGLDRRGCVSIYLVCNVI